MCLQLSVMLDVTTGITSSASYIITTAKANAMTIEVNWGDNIDQLLCNTRRSMLHQQNVNWSGRNTDSSRTLQATSPVLLSISRCAQTFLELSKALSDSARAFSGCYEIWLIEYSNFGAPETSAQICWRLWEKLRPLFSTAGHLAPDSHSSSCDITTMHFVFVTVTRFATS